MTDEFSNIGNEITDLIIDTSLGTLNAKYETVCFKLAMSHSLHGIKARYVAKQYPYEIDPKQVDLQEMAVKTGQNQRSVEPFTTYERAFRDTVGIRDKMLDIMHRAIGSVDNHCCDVLKEKEEFFYGIIHMRVTEEQKQALLKKVKIIK